MQTVFHTELAQDVPDFEGKPVYVGDTIVGHVTHRDGHTRIVIDPEHSDDFLKILTSSQAGASIAQS